MKNRIITISREFGSGGRTIGRTAAEELGIPCYDSELLQKIAIESGFAMRMELLVTKESTWVGKVWSTRAARAVMQRPV